MNQAKSLRVFQQPVKGLVLREKFVMRTVNRSIQGVVWRRNHRV